MDKPQKNYGLSRCQLLGLDVDVRDLGAVLLNVLTKRIHDSRAELLTCIKVDESSERPTLKTTFSNLSTEPTIESILVIAERHAVLNDNLAGLLVGAIGHGDGGLTTRNINITITNAFHFLPHFVIF